MVVSHYVSIKIGCKAGQTRRRVGRHKLSPEIFKVHNEKIKELVFSLGFHFNNMHDCVGKASSTAANQDPILV